MIITCRCSDRAVVEMPVGGLRHSSLFDTLYISLGSGEAGFQWELPVLCVDSGTMQRVAEWCTITSVGLLCLRLHNHSTPTIWISVKSAPVFQYNELFEREPPATDDFEQHFFDVPVPLDGGPPPPASIWTFAPCSLSPPPQLSHPDGQDPRNQDTKVCMRRWRSPALHRHNQVGPKKMFTLPGQWTGHPPLSS